MEAYVVANTHSGKGHGKKIIPELIEGLCELGYGVRIYETSNKDDTIKKVKSIADKYDLLGCIGGDGTMNEFVSAYIEAGSSTPVVYIPTGSTNDFARTLKLPKTTPKILEKIKNGEKKMLDMGRLADKYFCYVAAAGAFSEVSYGTSPELKKRLGHLAYVLEGVKSVSKIKPLELKITTDENVFEGRYLLCTVSNSTSIGGVIHLKKLGIALDDGIFEIVLISEPKNAAEYPVLFMDLLTENYKGKYLKVTNCSTLKIESEIPVSWSLDGEYGGAYNTTEIEILNKKLNIII